MFNTMKNFIVEKLKERKGEELYIDEIGFTLASAENEADSWYCNYYKAKADIIKDFDLCTDFCKWYELNGSLAIPNPFIETEQFHLMVMIYGIDELCRWLFLDRTYRDNYNEMIEIDDYDEMYITVTDELIEQVKKDLKDIDTVFVE